MTTPPKETWINPKIEIKETTKKGKGMFAIEPIKADEKILVWGGEYTDAQGAKEAKAKGKLVLQWDDNLYSVEDRGDDMGYFINHACDSNTWMKDAYTLTAKRDIQISEEITADYALWEADPNYISKWVCKCGSPTCRKKITGNDWKLLEVQKRYKGYFSLLINKRIEKAEKLNCVVIHGCPSNAEKAMNPQTRTYDKHWIPWLKKELVARGVKTQTPFMPDPWEPDYSKFKAEFEKYEVNENTILVGHSCGSAFLVRWLGETKRKIFKLILVAPWKIPDKDDEFRKEFYTYPIDESIKTRTDEIVMFTADDEEDEGKESLKIFHQALGGEIIELESHGHYTMGDMGTTEFPELLEVILK